MQHLFDAPPLSPTETGAAVRQREAIRLREEQDATEVEIERLQREAEVGKPDRANAAIEAAARFWEGGLATAVCGALDSYRLAIIGRSLLESGESVWIRRGGGVHPIPVASYHIEGASQNPNRWTYACDQSLPNGNRTTRVSGRDIFHVRIGVDPAQPHRGRSPIKQSRTTADILASLEHSLKQESAGPTGTVIPHDNPTDGLASDVRNVNGRVIMPATTALAAGLTAPQHEWRKIRLGPEFTQNETLVHDAIHRVIFAAAGIPWTLISGEGGDSREAWRHFQLVAMRPIGALIVDEFRRTGLTTTVDFPHRSPSDGASVARAYGAYRKAGMADGEARRVAGV